MDETNNFRPAKDEPIWSEILPGLWQGGTPPEDRVNRGNLKRITRVQFQSVFTMAAHANPVGNRVREFRFAILDADMQDFDPTEDLFPFVVLAHNEWKSGRKTLIRCISGRNRSGLLLALVLIREGYSPEDAISMVRRKRSNDSLSNEVFTEWLRSVDVDFWRSSRA